jgi:hypothetical protein
VERLRAAVVVSLRLTPVKAVFAALAFSLATILLTRLSLDLASWRSTLLTARLEHPA